MSNGARIGSIQALRGIAALGVVAFHFLEVDQKYAGPVAFFPHWLIGGATGVDLFFVISGFVMVQVTRGRFGRAAEVGRFVWHRASRIYPVYWFYFFMTLLAFIVHPAWVNASQRHQASDLLASFVLYPVDHLPFVQVAWSLIHEVWFYLVFGVLLCLPERLLPLLLLVWGMLIGLANGLTDIDLLSPAPRIALHPLTIEFLMGACVALLVNACLTRNVSMLAMWILLAVAVLAGLPIAVRNAQALQDSNALRAALLGPVYGAIVLSVVLLERRGRLRVHGFLRALGDRSYTLYLSHVLVIGTVGHFWVALRGAGVGSGLEWLLWPFMLAAVLCYAWVGYRYIEKPLIGLSLWLWSRHASRSEGREPAAASAVGGSGCQPGTACR